jgi:hypothetical protein
MSDHDTVQEGACRCGRVRFVVRGKPLLTMACHCTGCQKMTASAFSLSSLYPSDAFEIVEGEPVLGGMRASPRHFFCPDCMSWLFTRLVETDAFVNVRATMLEGSASFRPFMETYASEKLPWATTGAARSFAEFPSSEQYPDLIRAYAEQSDWTA